MKKISTILYDFKSSIITKENSETKIENDVIVQHNNLVEARYKLSLQEKRVVLWLLTQIKPSDEDFKVHKLEIEQFSRMTGLEPDNQYSKLQTVTLNLMKRVIKICESHTNSFFQVAWLSFARYHLTKGYIELRFDPALKPYLLQLKSHFTKITLSDITQLNSIYSIRIFELIKQYELIGKREISVEDLREYCGTAKTEYTRYNDFKKNVLERAKKEINLKTDIVIDYIEIKESRKIVAIEWNIHRKDLAEQKRLEQIERLDKELRSEQIIVDSLIEYGFSKMMAKRLITLHGEVTVKHAIRAVDLQVERGKAKNPKAMLKVAIEEQWHPEVFKVKNKN